MLMSLGFIYTLAVCTQTFTVERDSEDFLISTSITELPCFRCANIFGDLYPGETSYILDGIEISNTSHPGLAISPDGAMLLFLNASIYVRTGILSIRMNRFQCRIPNLSRRDTIINSHISVISRSKCALSHLHPKWAFPNKLKL